MIGELNVGEGPIKDEIETLHSLAADHKKSLSRLIGADSRPTEGLLLKKLSELLATCQSFPVLNVIQKDNVSDMVRQLSTAAEKAKSDIILALNEISTKLGTLSVSVEQESILEKFICEYDASLVCAH